MPARHAIAPLQAAPDWQHIVESLAAQFRAKVSIFWHSFAAGRAGGGFRETIGYSQEASRDYLRLANDNPWLFILRTNPVGTFIDGEARMGKDYPASAHAAAARFYQEWMVPHGAVRGLGAVLFKDRHPNPNWAMGISALRPDEPPGSGLYSDDEKTRFQAQIPFLIDNIIHHSFVLKHKRTYKNGTIWYDIPAPDDICMPETPPEHPTYDLEARRQRVIDAAHTGDEPLLTALERTIEEHRQQRQASPASITDTPADQPDGQAPKKRGRPPRTPPTDKEIQNAGHVLWQARLGEPLDEETRRKAKRDATWAYRERQRQKAGGQSLG